MKNEDLRIYAKKSGVPLWKVAERINVCAETLYRKLRKELSPESKKEIREIIDKVANDEYQS